MVAPVPPGAPRPNNHQNSGSGPANLPGNPNALPGNMQNLSISRPPPPFVQSQQSGVPQRGPSPMPRPGPPPGLGRPGGPPPASQPTGFPSNVPFNRPTGPPPSNQSPFGSRPSMSGGPAARPPGTRPVGFGSPLPVGPSMSMPPPSGTLGGPVSNGHQMAGPGGFPSGTQTPRGLSTQPPAAPFVRSPPQPLSMHSPLASSGAPSMPPPANFPGAPHGRPAVSGLPYGPTSAQVAPPLGFPGSVQPPTYGMGPLPNQSMTTIPPAVGQGGGSVLGPSRIDPSQIPRPGSISSPTVFETRQSGQANPPPPATSDYISKDTGNCSPRLMRCTINQIPCTADLLSTSGMQLALLVQPFALPHPSEEPIQVVDFGEGGPVRCSRCKGYINPFMKFVDQGRKFTCNFCGYTDETPRDYHCNLGPDGRRRDVDERPELCRGTVDIVATKEYMVRDPMPAVYFFLIDVSVNAIQTGATAAACNAIQQVLSDIPEGPRTYVGIATFDSSIHFYNLKRALQQPLMLIVPEVQDVYTPLETDVIVHLSECRQHLELLLDSIPTMFQESKIPESAFGAAVKAAYLAMKSKGGKLMVFQSVLCSVGFGALSSREAEGRANMSTAGEKEANRLLQPADKTFRAMAIEFAEFQVCVDIFITTQTYVDMASISVIPQTTGGQVYCYYPFSALSDPPKLYNDLKWNITRPQGFEAVMRVRCSQGIQVQEYSGNFCKRIPTDIDLPAIDSDKAVMVTLKHDDKLQDGAECSFQSALLYTTVYGERRIRVMTLSLPCTKLLSNLFRAADLDSQFSCMLKQAANEIPSRALPLVTEQATNSCINTLYAYRKFCASVTSTGQLILPEALKLFPLYTLALTKSVGLRTGGRVDERLFWVNYVSTLSTPLAIPLVYPRMISIHDLDEMDTEGSVLPTSIPLSNEHVDSGGVYFLENGVDGLIYVGESVNSDILQKLFNVPSATEIPSQYVLQQYDNELSKRFIDAVNEIRRQRCSYLSIKLCKKGDPSEILFMSYMVEDRTTNGSSYMEFLVQVHRQIQLKMT